MKKQKFALQARNYRNQIEQFLVSRGEWQYFSSIIYNHWRLVFTELLPEYVKGNVLDVGCGNAPYLKEIKKYTDEIVLMDISLHEIPISFLGNVHNIPLTDSSFDLTLCLQVLEHVPEPAIAIREIVRVMKSQGVLLLSVPHLSRLHEIPYDFYRYTEYGIRYLLESAGLEIIKLISTDGLVSFIGHQLSLSFLLTTWKDKLLRPFFLFINKYIFTLLFSNLDKCFGMKKIFPQGYVVVARKK